MSEADESSEAVNRATRDLKKSQFHEREFESQQLRRALEDQQAESDRLRETLSQTRTSLHERLRELEDVLVLRQAEVTSHMACSIRELHSSYLLPLSACTRQDRNVGFSESLTLKFEIANLESSRIRLRTILLYDRLHMSDNPMAEVQNAKLHEALQAASSSHQESHAELAASKEQLSQQQATASISQQKLEADLAAMTAERDATRREAELSQHRAVRHDCDDTSGVLSDCTSLFPQHEDDHVNGRMMTCASKHAARNMPSLHQMTCDHLPGAVQLPHRQIACQQKPRQLAC